MSEQSEDHDQNLEKYFDAKKREAIPEIITEDYTESVMQRLRKPKSVWTLLSLPVLGCVMGALLIFVFWRPAPSSLPAIEIERDAAILDQVSPADLPPEPVWDIMPQIDMLDTFVVAMESKEGRTLSIVQEAQVLTAVGADVNAGETPSQELELLDEIDAAGNAGKAKRA